MTRLLVILFKNDLSECHLFKSKEISDKIKPKQGIPWLRIIKEHVIDMFLGGLIAVWILHFFEAGAGDFFKNILTAVKQLGGLGAIGSFIALMHRIYFNGKKKEKN